MTTTPIAPPGVGLIGPTAAKIPIKWNGKTYLLPQLTAKDAGTIEAHVVLRKRDRILENAAMERKYYPEDVWQKLRKEAKREADAVVSATEKEVAEFMSGVNGTVFIFHLLFEKDYPGEFQPSDILEILGSLSEEEKEEFFGVQELVAGMPPALPEGEGPAGSVSSAGSDATPKNE